MHQTWMRDYDPTTGRYIQADPLGLVDGPSVYGYAMQNPGRYVDPRGEQAPNGPKGTTNVPGTGYSVRVDRPTAPNQQTHAHIYDRNGKLVTIINKDGTGSHKRDPKNLPKSKKLLNFLMNLGFKIKIAPVILFPGVMDLCIGRPYCNRTSFPGDLDFPAPPNDPVQPKFIRLGDDECQT